MSTRALQAALAAALGLFAVNPVLAVEDCNGNGQDDTQDITNGVSADQDGNGVPDECELCPATETDEFDAAPISAGDRFGFSVAAAADFAAVGAPRDDSAGVDAGLVVVYRAASAGSTVDATLTASDAAGLDHFGQAVAADGDVIAVGAPDDDDDGLSSGSVYVFRFDGDTWVQEAKLTASDASAGAEFGGSVCVSGDTIWVGAPGAAGDAGAVYVFDFMASGWEEIAGFSANDANGGDAFGTSLATDGSNVFVGAPFDDQAGANAGAVYVFTRSKGWTQDAKLMAADAQGGDRFGASVAASENEMLVGAPDEDEGAANGGAVYVFEGGGSSWTQTDKLVRHDSDPGDRFGEAVAAGSEVLAVASPGDDDGGSDAGAAHTYCRVAAVWRPVAMLVPADGHSSDGFGTAVAVSGPVAVVGAWQNDGVGSSAGTAYVFAGTSDCDANGRLDICELQDGTAADLNGNGVPDACDPDCNANGVPDDLDLGNGTADDCNGNGVPDSCDIADGTEQDCNANGAADSCEIADGAEDDCNGNGVPDSCDINSGGDTDCNANGMPDGCEGGSDAVCGGAADADGDGVPDDVDWCPKTKPGKKVDRHGCAKHDKALICHVPKRNPGARHELWVPPAAVKGHLRHGDWIGPCEVKVDPGDGSEITEPPGDGGAGTGGDDGKDDDGKDDPPGDGPHPPEFDGLPDEACASGAMSAVPLTMLGLVGMRRRRTAAMSA